MIEPALIGELLKVRKSLGQEGHDEFKCGSAGERQPGKTIGHPRGGVDDIINAVADVLKVEEVKRYLAALPKGLLELPRGV